MVDEKSFAAWMRALQTRRPRNRVDTRDAADRRFVAFAVSEGYAIVTTPSGEVPVADVPYILGVRLTPSGERILALTG